MTDCPKDYKNHTLGAFADGKYVTAEMLKQFCKNDSYLKNETEQLWLEVNPTSRKRFNPLPVDPNLSYGVTIPNNNDKVSRLSNSTMEEIEVDFTNLELIDSTKSTASVIGEVVSGKTIQKATIPLDTEKSELAMDTRNYSPWAIPVDPEKPEAGFVDYSDLLCNEYWYVSYRKDIPYELRTTWLKNPLHGSIPGVSRAQTFKAKETGVLEAVTLNIHGPFNVGTPLIICIHDTTDNKGIKYPKSSHDWSEGNPFLARQDVWFNNTDPGICTIRFENPCTVQEGESYAIAMYSPTTHPSEAYSIGGWSQSCQSKPYKDGSAFISENSGASWSRYGKFDETVPYHYGQQAPEDFAFICHIRKVARQKYNSDKDYYLYLKPKRCNPCNQVRLLGSITEVTRDHNISFEVSEDSKKWIPFDASKTITFSTKPTMIFIRAKLRTNSINSAPIIYSFNLSLNTDIAKEGYARLPYYCPPVNSILGANVWGAIYAPYKLESSESITDASIDLVSNKLVNEHYKFIKPIEIKEYVYFEELEKYKNEINNISVDDDAVKVLNNAPEIVEIFNKYRIYIKGYNVTLNLSNTPAYPIVSVILTKHEKDTKEEFIQFFEFEDYTIDYNNNTITITSKDKLDSGALNIQYNPLIVKGLKQKDLPFRLDYVQESFNIKQEDITQGRFKLKCKPNDPIMDVILNGTNYLEEDVDYRIDYQKGELILTSFNDQGKLIYNIGDKIKIIYTPHITDNGLSIAYNMKRTDGNYNIAAGIDNKGRCTYLEYKS